MASCDKNRTVIQICDLGRTEYGCALRFQSELVEKRIQGEVPDTIIFTEHDTVVTYGRLRGDIEMFDEEFFKKRNIPAVNSGRGGKITYHAPGQLVIYPVIDLRTRKKDVSHYIDVLEKVTIRALNRSKVPGERTAGRRGVWVGGRKIGFIGIAVKKWVTYHGVAVNVNNNTAPFYHMDPCGEKDIKVTSVREHLGHEVHMDEIKSIFVEEFLEGLGKRYSSDEEYLTMSRSTMMRL